MNATITYGSSAKILDLVSRMDVSTFAKREPIIEVSPIDMLVLSVTLDRLHTISPSFKSFSIIDPLLHPHIIPADYEMAETIRKFYSQRIMMWSILGAPLTKFRADLSAFIHSDGMKYEEKTVPLVCCIPSFYEYDKAIGNMQQQMRLQFPVVSNVPHHTRFAQEKTLTTLGRLTRKNASKSSVEFWFNDSVGMLHFISLDAKNPLLPLWDQEFSSNKQMTIVTDCKSRSIDDFPHYMLENWKLMRNS